MGGVNLGVRRGEGGNYLGGQGGGTLISLPAISQIVFITVFSKAFDVFHHIYNKSWIDGSDTRSHVYWEKVMNFRDFKLTLWYVLKRVLAMHMDFIHAKLSLTLCGEFERKKMFMV